MKKFQLNWLRKCCDIQPVTQSAAEYHIYNFSRFKVRKTQCTTCTLKVQVVLMKCLPDREGMNECKAKSEGKEEH